MGDCPECKRNTIVLGCAAFVVGMAVAVVIVKKMGVPQ